MLAAKCGTVHMSISVVTPNWMARSSSCRERAWAWESIIPGSRVEPAASITGMPGGTATPAPTA
jgi:hypothetical protein